MPKLLIVDDEVDIREFTRNYFRKRQIEVLVASNGLKALEIISLESPDLTLLDLKMDGISGLDVLRVLRDNDVPAKVIVVSGMGDEETKKEALDLGAVTFINKPYILEDLEQIVLLELGQTTSSNKIIEKEKINKI